jgi:alpha-glucosidase
MHHNPSYTIAETRDTPYSLLVFQADDGYAFGHAYVDDGESTPPTPSRDIYFRGAKSQLKIESRGNFDIEPRLERITILNIARPRSVLVQGSKVYDWDYIDKQQKLSISGLEVSLNEEIVVKWE